MGKIELLMVKRLRREINRNPAIPEPRRSIVPGIRDGGSMMDQTSQKIRAIRDRLYTLLVLLLNCNLLSCGDEDDVDRCGNLCDLAGGSERTARWVDAEGHDVV